MIELLDTYAPVVSLLSGMIVGAVLTRRRPRESVAPEVPTCGCSHQLALHDPATDKCYGRTGERYSDRRGDWVTDPCPCRQYVGPKPIDQVFQPRVLPPTE